MAKKTTPTMRDVARLAEVSIATVSAVINETAGVSPRRAERVRKAIEALDYHADHIARSLKTGRTYVVGMVIPDVTNAFYPEVMSAAEVEAAATGYSVLFCNANEDPAQEQRQLNTLFSHRADGVLIACSDSAAAYDRLMRRRFPIVFFDRIPRGFRGLGVATNNFTGGYQATRHLIDLGHQQIGILAGRLDLSTHTDRLEGFRKAMQEAQLPVRDEYYRVGGLQVENGYQFGRELLTLAQPPTGVFCGNNKMLLGFLRAMGELGVRCPADISIVGFDDYAWTENYHPKLTTVAQPTREIGRRAMQLLIRKISGTSEIAEPQEILLDPKLLIRESTAPPRQHWRIRTAV